MKRYLLILTAIAAAAARAQDHKLPEEPKLWKLDFVLEELSPPKPPVLRNYTLTVSSIVPTGTVRTGDKVPVAAKDGSWTFVDVGVNIDCRVDYKSDETLHLFVTADISSIAGTGTPPLINQTKWSGEVKAPIGKSTTVFIADGSATKRQTKLEVTARPAQ